MDIVILAAGSGTRFAKEGILEPKPLIIFFGYPLFWWAAKSALSGGVVSDLHFAVLQEHISIFSIDKKILSFFPDAHIHHLEEVTSGAAETAALTCMEISKDKPVCFVDCDLAFSFQEKDIYQAFDNSRSLAGLSIFESNNPAYSYLKYDSRGIPVGTIEKTVVSNSAIAGVYLFSSAIFYLQSYEHYSKSCNYSELFLSGVYNVLFSNAEHIETFKLSSHLSLGTPDDLINAEKSLNIPSWYFS